MDVKNLSWVGDMRQKFEALCMEVDETIYEDTVKYVRNQMRTVGETVKNFYSEVMQDFLASSPIHSAKGNDAPVTVAPSSDAITFKKPKLDNGSEPGQEQYTPENSQGQFTDFVSNQSTPIKDYSNSWQEQDHQLKSPFDLSCKDSVEELTSSTSQNGSDEYLSGCMDISSNEASAVKVRENNENEVEIYGDLVKVSERASVVNRSQITRNHVGEVSTDVDNTVLSTDAIVDTTIVDDIENVVEAGNELSDSGYASQGSLNLEGSCVLVEKDDHFSKATLENVRKSYKKKIREAFSPQRWSKSKKDKEQLCGSSEGQNRKSLLCTSTSQADIQKSQTPDFFESEWELL